MSDMWRIGDRHECPVWSDGRHTANDVCAAYAIKHGDRKFQGEAEQPDLVNHPPHYTQYQGFEVIDVTENLNFCLGNAVKYILRADFKNNAIEDLKKSRWYLDREIARREAAS